MTSAPLFIEIGTEDLPARYVAPLAEALLEGFRHGLNQRGIGFGTARRFATPRRLAVHIADVAGAQPEQLVQRDGPTLAIALNNGEPTRAGLGFAKSCGVAFAALAHKNGKLYFEARTPGAHTAELVPAIFTQALARMDTLVPKRMHWDGSADAFVRPVRWIVALYAGTIVPLRHFGLTAGRTTYGHRFHAPASIELDAGANYEKRLRVAYVWADVATRRAEIRRQIEAAASRLGGTARISGPLLDEVTSLVEWPVVITGGIEARFMELPPEVIVATVETNQRYFTVFDAGGKLLPAFITISNIESKDPAQVVAGNERVVRPRLADGLFFWHRDLRQPLSAYGAQLAAITFQKKLGSLADKVARTAALAERLALHLGADAGATRRAAVLCKNDLATQMVGEFPELQGIMGGYYAARSGEPAVVAAAIRDHYLPNQQGGALPASAEGQAVALADKLDTLAGYFAVGEKPTASKDPFALRRAALGVVRILVEGGHDLDLRDWLAAALQAQPAGARGDAGLAELLAFVQERQRAWSLGRTIDGQVIDANSYEAVAQLGSSRPLDIERRLAALTAFMATPVAASLAAADKRARNILRQAGHTATGVDRSYLRHPAGEALVAALDAARADLRAPREAADYTAMLTRLAALKEPVDAFFDQVRVMDDDAAVRAARLGVLAQLDALCREVADLSQLPG